MDKYCGYKDLKYPDVVTTIVVANHFSKPYI